MQSHTKGRIFGLLFFLFFSGAIAYNWHLLITEGRYYLQASWLTPAGALMGLALIFFPSMAFRARLRDKKFIAIMLIVGILGLTLGGMNFYTMDHYK